MSGVVGSRSILKYRIFHRFWRYFCSFFIGFAFTSACILVGTQSNQSVRNGIAGMISSAALASDSQFLNLNLTKTDSATRTDHIDAFNLASEINDLDFNRTGYNVYAGYNQYNSLFADKYQYLVGGNSVSVLASPVNSLNPVGDTYTHEIWGGDFLFPPNGFTIQSGDSNFCYIPVSLADDLISKNSLDGYETLIGTSLKIDFINKTDPSLSRTLSWTIRNIFDYNNASAVLNQQFGTYICCYYSLPTYEYPSVCIQFGHSLYTNRHYLNWLKENIDLNEYSFGLNFNLESSFQLDEFVDEFVNNYYSGFSDTVFELICGLTLLLTIILECCFLFMKHHLASWPFAIISLAGICFGSLFVHLFSMFGFGLSPTSLYFSAVYFLLSLIALLIVRLFVQSSGRVRYFETDRFRI